MHLSSSSVSADRRWCGGDENAVRWAYTQERYDVTEFLVGGEILIIEGSALAEHADDEG